MSGEMSGEIDVILADLLTILDEVETQLNDGETNLPGISANNVAYIKGVVSAGRASLPKEVHSYGKRIKTH